MLNFLKDIGTNIMIKHKKKNPYPNQGQWNQNQGQWGGYNQGNWGNQGGWYEQNQGGWGEQNQWGSQNNWGCHGCGVLNEESKKNWGNHAHGQQWIQQQRRINQYNVVKPQEQAININQLIAEQIVFIQPSPAQQKLQQLKELGQPFIDEQFPADQNSLTGQYGPQQEWQGIKWKPITKIMKKPVIFHEQPHPNDIKQGYLGDCYFLAGLAALAERPDRIFNLFLLQELNQQKYFSVKMLYKGKWMTIDLDQYIPYYDKQPAFSRSGQDELWVILLEKAWAKLYTSYRRIEAGYGEEPLHDLTGAPTRQIGFKNNNFNKQQEWAYLLEASNKQYAMIASSQPGSDRNKSVKGVVNGHAYTLLNAINLHFNGSLLRLVQLRNPWGKGQWTGEWSDKDPNWNYVSPQEKQRIGFKPNADDGVFWMTYDDFITQFRAVTIAEIDDNASYVYRSMKDQQCKGVYFAIDILKEDLYSFQVDKTPQRIYPQEYQQNFQYPETLIQLGKLQGKTCKKLQGLKSLRRTLVKKERLTPGRYIAYVKISYNPDYQDQYDVNLAVYSSTACSIRLASYDQAVIFTGDQNVEWTGQENQGQQQNQENQYEEGEENNEEEQGNGQNEQQQGGQQEQGEHGGNDGWEDQGNQGW